ncbi:hypothetical protein GGF50DRAFT_117933 [Schizophyllum commune]
MLFALPLVGVALSALASVARADVAWDAKPFNPHSIPLAVRSPYLSAWLPQGAGKALNEEWPAFWTGSPLGWAGFVKVDGKAYSWLGNGNAGDAGFEHASQKSSEFTATQSTFVLSAGPVDLTVNFLSPVEPTDLVKGSLPFAYLEVSVHSTDGTAHEVQIYSDISAEWVSGDSSLQATWSTRTGEIITHQAQLKDQAEYSESNDHTQYGSIYYSTSWSNSATYQTGSDVAVRAQFINNGVLANTEDTNFRAISDNWPVFGLAHDLGSVFDDSVLFTIGHVRDPAIQYATAGNVLQDRSLYAWSAFGSVDDMISSFLSSYSDALATAQAFDAKLQSDASAVSDAYAAICALSVRQAFGAVELTISKNEDGSWNTDDVLLFMKEISSDGNMNTVDVIFPAWPILLYTNPALGKYLLDALYRYQESGLYPNKWSIHDMGSSYPKALGHNDGKDEAMPVEESGNMLIMALSYTQKTGDLSMIQDHSALIDQWTQYLIEDSLIPGDQLSTDDFAGHLENQTNLAIKGIVGIGAMAEIAKLLGDEDKANNYSSIAKDYVSKWQTYATASSGDHLTLQYGQDDTWGLSYNLYGDKLLGLGLFPDSIYEMQTAWYNKVKAQYGVALDTRHGYTKSDWEIWTSAWVTDNSVRDALIQGVYDWASSGLSDEPFGDWYETADLKADGFRARPVVGGHLAHLIL